MCVGTLDEEETCSEEEVVPLPDIKTDATASVLSENLISSDKCPRVLTVSGPHWWGPTSFSVSRVVTHILQCFQYEHFW